MDKRTFLGGLISGMIGTIKHIAAPLPGLRPFAFVSPGYERFKHDSIAVPAGTLQFLGL